MSAFTINIQSKDITLSSAKIELFLQYVFNATDANVVVYFKDDKDTTIDIKNVYIPVPVYAAWQNDDTIVNYVLAQLNLTKL